MTKQLSLGDKLDALSKFRDKFGYAELSSSLGGWCVSNKTDEGLGGGGPTIRLMGRTLEETLEEVVTFIENPAVPKSIKCQKCGTPMPVGSVDYKYGAISDAHFVCWGHDCFDGIYLRDICPECFGKLETFGDRRGPNWKVKCNKCGKVCDRGRDVNEVYAKLETEPLDESRLD